MTTVSSVPDDIRRFILTSIPSVPFLEALLLLRAETAAPWESKHLAQRLYMSEAAARDLLAALHAAGMLACDENAAPSPLYHYAPVSESLRTMISQLADIYARQLIEVTHLIHSTTGRRAQRFADAFKWRKES